MFVLLFSKVVATRTLAVDGAGQVITAVTDTFDFGHFAQHATDFQLTFRTQTTFGYLVQIVGDFQFHVITDVFILFDTAEELVEFVFVGRVKQFIQHTEHTAHTFREEVDFLAGLNDGKFRSRKQTTGNEAEAVFFLHFLLWDNLANGLFDEFHEPNQDQYVTDIEGGMEG